MEYVQREGLKECVCVKGEKNVEIRSNETDKTAKSQCCRAQPPTLVTYQYCSPMWPNTDSFSEPISCRTKHIRVSNSSWCQNLTDTNYPVDAVGPLWSILSSIGRRCSLGPCMPPLSRTPCLYALACPFGRAPSNFPSAFCA